MGNGSSIIRGKAFNFDPKYAECTIKNIDISFDRFYDFDKDLVCILRIMELDGQSKKPGKDLTEMILLKLEKCKKTDNFICSSVIIPVVI